MTNTTCPASGKLPINHPAMVTNGGDVYSEHYGWPHMRTLCNECGNTYQLTAKGLVRKHKAIHVAASSDYAAEGFRKLMAEHPTLQAPGI